MRTMKLLCFWLVAACLPLSALAVSTPPVPDERALREECSVFSQAEMRDCLEKKAEDSQRALQQAQDNVTGILSQWDEDRHYVSQAKAKITISNKTFLKYRHSHCEFLASLSGGGAGNAHDMRRLACVSELNNRRAEQLRNAVSDLPLK